MLTLIYISERMARWDVQVCKILSYTNIWEVIVKKEQIYLPNKEYLK